MTERVVEALEVVEVDEEDGERVPIATAAPIEGSPDALPEEGPVGEPRQAVVERLVADGVVQPGILESHGRLAGEHLGDLEVARVEGAAAIRRQLERPDRGPRGNERDDHHALLVDRGEVGDLLAIGRGIGGVDDRGARLLEDHARRRVVGKRVGRLECVAPFGREVAKGDHPVRGLIPVAQGTVTGPDGLADVPGDAVADELRVHGPGEVVGHGDDAPQVVGRRLHPATDLPQEDEQEDIRQDERQERDSLGDFGREAIAGRQDLLGDDRPDPDYPGDEQRPADIPAAQERQDEDGRQERGDRHRDGKGWLDDRARGEQQERQRCDPRNDALAADSFDHGSQVGHQSGISEDGQAEPDGPRLAIGEPGHDFEDGDTGRGAGDRSEHRPQLAGAPIDPDRHVGDEFLAEVDNGRAHLHWMGHASRR